jgi:7,8-dihydropterin-6-yl-methyl-4-(beta-D-ribofuranosyl)aminobenzene 5'-phosphate synthase
MAVKTDKGIVLIVGCSHPKMAHILDAGSQFGKVHAIIGGLHGFREYDLFKDLELICPTHCTQHKAEIRSLYPEKYTEGGAGRIIEL